MASCFVSSISGANGWRYPLVGGTRQRLFAGTNFKPRKVSENAVSPTSRVLACKRNPQGLQSGTFLDTL
jgi:hypothetical protein